MDTEALTHGSTGSTTDWADEVLLSLNIPRERRPEERVSADCQALRSVLEQDAKRCRLALSHRPILVVLSGLPGTGKSYFARALADRVPLLVLESDRLRKILFSRPNNSSAAENIRLFSTISRLILEYLVEGLPVVFDATNLRESHRRDVYRIADNLGIPMVPVFCSAQPTVVQRRLERRKADAGFDVYSDSDWQVYRRLFHSLEPIVRKHITVDSVDTFSEAVEHIVQLASTEGSDWELPVRMRNLGSDKPGDPAKDAGKVPESQRVSVKGEAEESFDEFPIGSVHAFIEVLDLHGVQLGISPMFSPTGNPINLAGQVAVALGWQPYAELPQDYATGGRGSRQVLSEAFKINPRELQALQKAESGETYKTTQSVLGRLQIFCRNNRWTRDDRPEKHTRLEQGANSHHSVKISYLDSGEEPTDHIIDIYAMGNGYVDALDHLTNATMLFNISDVQRVQVTDNGYIIPESYSPSERLEEYQERYGPPYIEPKPVKPKPVKPEPVKSASPKPVHAPGPTYDDSTTIDARWNRLSRSERLRLAAEHHRSVEIGYIASERYRNSETTKRVIDIHGVGNRYVDAYCHLRKAMRRFKISRIQTVDITNLTFHIPGEHRSTERVQSSPSQFANVRQTSVSDKPSSGAKPSSGGGFRKFIKSLFY